MELLKKVFEVDDKEMEKARIEYSEALRVPFSFKPLFRKPAGVIGIEDFYPGPPTHNFGLWYDEVIIVIKGKADIECRTPKAVGSWETKTVSVEAGDCFFMFKGEQVSFEVTSEEAFRHLCIIMPAHPFPQLI